MALKDHPETGPEGQRAKAAAEKADSANADQVQEKVDQELKQGFRGVEVDSTPNEAYTVAGVTSGMPTPETDEAQAEQVRKDQKNAEKLANGVAER